MEELAGVKARLEFQPRHSADTQATWAHIGKAEQLLGWRPQVAFREGISRLVSWYRSNRAWAKEVSTG
ncbi:MAG: hypothetical protein M1358_04295 [Chloroflexi bacterium]|nr:hypothetical protein [Chloroflexota bacterium]